MNVHRHVVFRAGTHSLAVAIEHVARIVPYTTPTPVPGTAENVRGIVQHRGKMLPVVDMGGAQPNPFTLLVIVEGAHGTLTGVIADEVKGIVDLGTATPIASAEAGLAPVLCDDSVVLVVDVERAFVCTRSEERP